MIIKKINKPIQDQFTRDEDIELIDGEKKYWFTITSLYTESQGGYDKFIKDIEIKVQKKGFKGIYLYEVGSYERKLDVFKKDIEKVIYIRWDYYN